MLLYLVRHGEAHPGSLTTSDASRQLNPRGRRQCQWIAEQIVCAEGLAPPTLLLASGLVRATQSAQIICKIVGCELRCERALELGWSVDDVLNLVLDELHAGGAGPIMLVGHNPQMEAIVHTLAANGSCEMRTGTVALIEVDCSNDGIGTGRLLETMRMSEA